MLNFKVNELYSQWSWIILSTTIPLYLYYWYRRPRNFPSGPRGIPFFGYVPFVGKKPQEVVFQLSKKYGPIFSMRMGSDDIVFLNDLDSLQKAFVKQGAVFSGRPAIPPFDKIKHGHGIVFADYGNLWKSQRKFGLMTLRGFGVGKKGMENICLEELLYLNEEVKKNKKAFDMSNLLHNAVSNNVCNVAFGKRFHYGEEEFHKILENVINTFEHPMLSFVTKLIIFAPKLRYLPLFSYYYKILCNNVQKILDWLQTIVNEHEKTFDENNLRDFIDAFILEKRKGNEFFTDFQLLNFIHELLVAGTETAASTLRWCLLGLIYYPEAQKKMREEIKSVIGSSGTISMSRKSEMPYTCAFIQEIFRYRTLAPLALPHRLSDDTVLEGFFIPKGTKVQANIWGIHNDSGYWKEPEKFIPERFLDEEGQFLSSNHVIPFSVGPRHCLGEQLARMEIFIFLVGLVQKFEFFPDPDDKEVPSIEKGTSGNFFTPLPYKIFAKVT